MIVRFVSIELTGVVQYDFQSPESISGLLLCCVSQHAKKASRIGSRLAADEPEVLRLIGVESRSNGTDTLSSRRIDQVVKDVRTKSPSLRKKRERLGHPK